MYAVCVSFRLQPGEVRRFMLQIKDNAATSLETEDGCRRFDVCSDQARPDEVFLFEIYDSPEAFALHKASDHYARFDASVAGMVAKKTVKTYTSVW